MANSVLWGILALVGVYFAGARISGRWGGLISACLLATLPLAVKESGDLRMYSMVMGLSSWSCLAVLAQLTDSHPWRWGAAAAALSLGIAWSQGAGVLWFVFWATFALALTVQKSDNHSGLRAFLPTFAVAAGGALPCVIDAIERRPGHLEDSEVADWTTLMGQLFPGADTFTMLALTLALILFLGATLTDSRPRGPLVAVAAALLGTLAVLWVMGQKLPLVHIRAVAFLAPVAAIVVGSAIGRGLTTRAPHLKWGFLAAFVALLGLSFSDLWPQLEKGERNSSNHVLAQKLHKSLSTGEAIWAPRPGTGYSLCWELAERRAVEDPSDGLTCTTRDGQNVYTDQRRPRELNAPYTLVLRNKERVPRLASNERRLKVKKISGHEISQVVENKSVRAR